MKCVHHANTVVAFDSLEHLQVRLHKHSSHELSASLQDFVAYGFWCGSDDAVPCVTAYHVLPCM